MYYSGLPISAEWVTDVYLHSPPAQQRALYIEETVNFHKVLIHLAKVFLSFYFKIQDVITFIKVSESGMEGDSWT